MQQKFKEMLNQIPERDTRFTEEMLETLVKTSLQTLQGQDSNRVSSGEAMVLLAVTEKVEKLAAEGKEMGQKSEVLDADLTDLEKRYEVYSRERAWLLAMIKECHRGNHLPFLISLGVFDDAQSSKILEQHAAETLVCLFQFEQALTAEMRED